MTTGIISANPSELIDKGNQVMSEATRLQGEATTVTNLANPAEIFSGAASSQYIAILENWKSAQQQMLDSLHSLGDFLTKAAQAIEETDEHLKAALGIQ